MPKKKEIFNISVHCAGCRAKLFDYAKEGGGHLVKCFVSNITNDATPEGTMNCPDCGQAYARPREMSGRPVRKIIQGKVTVRGHVRS